MAGVTVHRLRTDEGFERFLVEVHRVIHAAGRGACLVFDCLSPLVETWCSDRMLANFFLLTSAYVHDHRSLAYFPLLRNFHSFHASTPIAETAPGPGRSLSAQRATVRPSHEGRRPLLADDPHAAPLGRRRFPAGHRKLDDRRDPHLAAVGRAGVDPPAAGQVDAHLPPGRGSLAGHPPRRAARRGRRQTAARVAPHDHLARAAGGPAGGPLHDACPTCWKSGNG